MYKTFLKPAPGGKVFFSIFGAKPEDKLKKYFFWSCFSEVKIRYF